MKNCQKPLGGALLVLVLSATALGLWLWKQPGESTEPERPGPRWAPDSSRSSPHADTTAPGVNPLSNPPPQSGMQTESTIDAFEGWMERYFNAGPGQRDQLTEEWITLANVAGLS